MNEQVKISSASSAEKQFLFANAPDWKECKDRERKELLKFMKTHEEKEKLARIAQDIGLPLKEIKRLSVNL